MTVLPDLLNAPLILDKARPVHFVGIGGIGMSGLARILLESGFKVSGSDITRNASTEKLASMGAKIFNGHSAENLPDNAYVVVSTSITNNNPEVEAARTRKFPIAHRSSLLREILHGESLGHTHTVGITGTHGKTTITGMTGVALTAANLSPSIIAGGILPEMDTNAVLSANRQYAVAELDESDGSIIQYTPEVTVISNLELDHADHYTEGLGGVIGTFEKFLSTLKPGSKVIYNVSCPQTKALSETPPEGVEAILVSPGDTFNGNEAQVTYWLKNARHHGHGAYQGYVYKNRGLLGELHLNLPGKHNLFNALCAIAAGDQLGSDFDAMTAALRTFTGMKRRFEKTGEFNNATLIDDYAHHPTEVRATLATARDITKATNGRVVAIFQPHRYSRLKALWDDFAACLDEADVVYITDVYSASEEPIEGATADVFAKSVSHPNCQYFTTLDEHGNYSFDVLRAELKKISQRGDLIISLGAGNLTQLLRNWD